MQQMQSRTVTVGEFLKFWFILFPIATYRDVYEWAAEKPLPAINALLWPLVILLAVFSLTGSVVFGALVLTWATLGIVACAIALKAVNA